MLAKPTVVVIINYRYEKEMQQLLKLLIRKLYTVLLLLLLAAPPDEILKIVVLCVYQEACEIWSVLPRDKLNRGIFFFT